MDPEEVWAFARRLRVGDIFKATFRSEEDDEEEPSNEAVCTVTRSVMDDLEGIEKYAAFTCPLYEDDDGELEELSFPQDGNNGTSSVIYEALTIRKRAVQFTASPVRSAQAKAKATEKAKRESAAAEAAASAAEKEAGVAAKVAAKTASKVKGKEKPESTGKTYGAWPGWTDDFLGSDEISSDDDDESEEDDVKGNAHDGMVGKVMTDPMEWGKFQHREQVTETIHYLKERFGHIELHPAERYFIDDILETLSDMIWGIFRSKKVSQSHRIIKAARRLILRLFMQEQLRLGATKEQVEALRTAYRDEENAAFIQKGIDVAKANLRYEYAGKSQGGGTRRRGRKGKGKGGKEASTNEGTSTAKN